MSVKLRNVGDFINKVGESDFQIKIEPERRLVFELSETTPIYKCIQVMIENTTEYYQTFKVKCTSMEIFKVRPPIGYIEPKKNATISVVFSIKNDKTVPECFKHYFAFYHSKLLELKPRKDPEFTKELKEYWSKLKKFDGVRRMWCIFLKSDGTEYTPLSDNNNNNK
ncbi:MSP domain and PapD-like domain-containing protein [Strongyloides ratti]|uniref:Major sperm protein n=1 Tax=Strongyloides ratti TaxID=34506 RepID=A0A090LQB5_STRRB|nr:MSP domain and PapD-like domain-containing protein [Strongyloides ratti]CEF70376.1 MSP domain and PapD-like domain-containing protein [Strongyloides ratti]